MRNLTGLARGLSPAIGRYGLWRGQAGALVARAADWRDQGKQREGKQRGHPTFCVGKSRMSPFSSSENAGPLQRSLPRRNPGLALHVAGEESNREMLKDVSKINRAAGRIFVVPRAAIPGFVACDRVSPVGWGFGRWPYVDPERQSVTVSPGIHVKWAVFPVPSVRLDSSAVAAMIRSASPRG